MGKLAPFNLNVDNLNYFGMITLIIKRSKRLTLRKGKNSSLSNLNLINLGKILRLRITLQMGSRLEIVKPVLEGPLTKSF